MKTKPDLKIQFSPSQITKTIKKALASAEEKIQKIEKRASNELSCENTFFAFDQLQADLNEETSIPSFLQYVSDKEELRNASNQTDILLGQFFSQLYFTTKTLSTICALL